MKTPVDELNERDAGRAAAWSGMILLLLIVAGIVARCAGA